MEDTDETNGDQRIAIHSFSFTHFFCKKRFDFYYIDLKIIVLLTIKSYSRKI